MKYALPDEEAPSRRRDRRSVTVRIRAAEFSATMTAISEWLDANRHKPTRYKYDHSENAVLVTVDFPAAMAAEAFALRFEGVYLLSPQSASPDSPRRSRS
jgi:hypothetical protein